MARRRLLLPGLLLPLLLVTGLVFLVSSTSGLRLLAAAVEAGSGGRVAASGVDGRLLGPLQVGRLRVMTAAGGVEAEGVELDWSPRQLLAGELQVQRLQVGLLRLLPGPPTPRRPPPERLELPLAVRLEVLRIDRLVLRPESPAAERGRAAAIVAPDDLPLLQAVAGRLESDGRLHRWQAAGELSLLASALNAGDGVPRFTIMGTLDGAAAPLLRATARLQARHGERQVSLAATTDGPLTRLPLQLTLEGDAQGTGDMLLTPFAPLPVAAVGLHLRGVDPALWLPGAGQAAIDLELALQPAGEGFGGVLRLVNGLAGPLDRGRWPLRALRGDLHWTPQAVRLDALEAQLPSGRVSGRLLARRSGVAPGTAPAVPWQLDGQLHLADVDPARLHRAARPARLRGDLELRADSRRQTLQGVLEEPRFALRFIAEREGTQLRLQQGRLSGTFGQARLAGQIDLAGPRDFHLEAMLEGVQPHRFLALPPMELYGQVLAAGSLLPAWQVRLGFSLDGSRVDGVPVDLNGSLALEGRQRLIADLNLRQAANRVRLAGSLGQPGDHLQLQLDAPHLLLPGLRLRGQGEVLLSGRLERPAARADLRIDELAVGERWLLEGLTAQANLPADAGPLDLHLQLAALRGPGGASGSGGAGNNGAGSSEWLRQADIQASGSLAEHRLTASSSYRDGGRLRLALAGGVADEPAGSQAALPGRRWRGRLTQAELVPPASLALPAFRLVAPAPVQFDARGLSLGELQLDSPRGRLRLARFLWQKDGGLRLLQGEAEAFPVAPFLPPAFAGSDLLLRGEWLFDAERPADSRLRIERSSGDLRVEMPQPMTLGLTELVAGADLSHPGRVDLAARISGEHFGTARASATLVRDGSGLAVDLAAPWQGQANWSLPDLAFLGPLLAPGTRTGGRLTGDVALRGSPQQPLLSGVVSGQGLDFLVLDNGLHLSEGTLDLRLEQQALVVQELRFKDGSRLAPPRDELSRLAGGGVSAHGNFDLAARSGSLTVDLDRLGLMQRRDVWLRASGQGDIKLQPSRLELRGALRVDGAAFHLGPGFGNRAPSLSDDVVIVGRTPTRRGSLPLDVDLGIALGEACYLRMKEVDSRLVGDLRIQARPGNPLRVAGSVRTADGVFTVYGQRLAIERGILNFQGPIDNPGLNILAMRREQTVAAGVEVTGTALKPRVQLVSEPEVGDTDKLSWLVLGRGTEQLGSNDPGMLAAVAKALFAESGGEGTLENIQRRLGVSVSVREGQIGNTAQAPSSAIVGNRTTSTAGTRNTVVGVSTRLAQGVSLSLEEAVGLGQQLASITLEMSRRLSLVLSTGVDHSVDVRYAVDFGGKQAPAAGKSPTPSVP